MKYKTRFRELELILWAAWNPIAPGVPTDEFENYAPRLLGMLERGADASQIRDDLGRIQQTTMSTEPNGERDMGVAEMLLIWYEEQKSERLEQKTEQD